MAFTSVGFAQLTAGGNQKVTPTVVIAAGSCILAVQVMSDAAAWPGSWTPPTDTSGNTYTLIGSIGYSAGGRLVGLNVYACFNCIALNGFIAYHDNISGIGNVLFDPFVTGITTGQKYLQDVAQTGSIPGLVVNGQNGGNTILGLVASTDASDLFTQAPTSGPGVAGNYGIVSQIGNGPTRSSLNTAQLGTVGQSNGPLGPDFVSYMNSPAAHVRMALVFDTDQFPRQTNLVCHSAFDDTSGHNVPVMADSGGWTAGSTVIMAVSGAYAAGGTGIISDSAGNVYTALGGATCTNVVGAVLYMCRNALAVGASGYFNFGVGAGSYATVAAAVFPGAIAFTDFKPSLRNGAMVASSINNGAGDFTPTHPLTLPLPEYDHIVVEVGASVADGVSLASGMIGLENFGWGKNHLWFGINRIRGGGTFTSNDTFSTSAGHARLAVALYSNYQFTSATLRGAGAVGLGSVTWKRAGAAVVSGVGVFAGEVDFLFHDAPTLGGFGSVIVDNTLVERHSNAAAFIFANGGSHTLAALQANALAKLDGGGGLELRLGFKIYEQFLYGEGFIAQDGASHIPVVPAGDTVWMGAGIFLASANRLAGIRPYRISDYYLDLYTSEHKDKPLLEAQSRFILDPLTQTQSLLSAMPDLFDLDLAVGIQLDHVGEWVGRTRYLDVPVDSFYSYDIEGLGLDQGHWKGPFDPDEGLFRLDDDYYRMVLRAVIGANTWDGSIPGVYRAWGELAFNVLIQDTGHMAALIALQGPVPNPLTLAIFTGDVLKIRPGGVKVVDYMVETVDNAPFFGYDVANGNISGYDGGAYGRMIPPSVIRFADFGFLIQSLHGEGFVRLRENVKAAVSAVIGGRGFLTIPLHEVSKNVNVTLTLVGQGSIGTFKVSATTIIAGKGFMPTNARGLKMGDGTILAGAGAMHNDAGTDAFIIGVGAVSVLTNVELNDAPELDGVGTLTVSAVVRALTTGELDGAGSVTGTGSEGPFKGGTVFFRGEGNLIGDSGADAGLKGEGFFTSDAGVQ